MTSEMIITTVHTESTITNEVITYTKVHRFEFTSEATMNGMIEVIKKYADEGGQMKNTTSTRKPLTDEMRRKRNEMAKIRRAEKKS